MSSQKEKNYACLKVSELFPFAEYAEQIVQYRLAILSVETVK